MTAIRRIARSVWLASSGRREVIGDIREDPATADDGLIALTVIGVVASGLATFDLVVAASALLVAPLGALAAASVVHVVSRIARHRATLAEATATVTLPSLPLLLLPVPLVGPPIALTWWILAGIVMLQRLTLSRLDVAAVVLLLSHALTVGAVMAAAFAIRALV